MKTSDYPLVIIGAGAAGLGASEQATELGIEHLVLEAAHRSGGRGLTEYLEGGIAVDLGCHWLHCASKNPYVAWADRFGFQYEKGNSFEKSGKYNYRMHFHGSWLDDEGQSAYDTYMQCAYASMKEAYEKFPDSSVLDAIDCESKWSSHFLYWMSLMHSNDIDQVSLRDVMEFHDTNEDWPVQQGYGALIAKQGEEAPVKLNCEVREINWGGGSVVLDTANGMVRCEKVIVTVSTGVLGAGQIRFVPELPDKTRNAIDALPLGNSNYQFFTLSANALKDLATTNIHYESSENSMAIRIRPFGTPCLFTSTGGRFAWWLEKQGPEASRDYLESALVDIFGSNVRSDLGEFKVSAWGFDPWIRGAYSSQKPGSGTPRRDLAEVLDERLQFAGEAVSTEFFNTAHGAYLSGKSAVRQFFSARG